MTTRSLALVTVLSLALSSAALAQTPQPDPKDPLYQHTGEQNRSYVFPGTTETIPYHLYVPAKWKPGMHLPLVSNPVFAPGMGFAYGAFSGVFLARGWAVLAAAAPGVVRLLRPANAA